MPNPLLSAVGSSVSDTVVGGARSLLGSAIDTGFNKKMMNYQNKLNQENATIAYQRQRELTEDSALLNKRGFAKAGINTAFGQNGNVTTASSPMSPSVGLGSASPSTNGLGSLTGMSDNVVKSAQADLLDSQREGVDIDNKTRDLKNYAEIRKLFAQISESLANARSSDAKTFYQQMLNDLVRKYGDRKEKAITEDLENKADVSASESYMKQLESGYYGSYLENRYNTELQTLDNLKKQGRLSDKNYDLAVEEIKNKRKQRDVMDSEIRKNDSIVRNTDEDTEGKKVDNETKRWIQPHVFAKAVNDATLSELSVVRAEILNVPKTIEERWSLDAYYAFQRIKGGYATKEDYNIYYRELFREYHNSAVKTVNEYIETITRLLPLKSAKSGSLPVDNPNSLSVPSQNLPVYR